MLIDLWLKLDNIRVVLCQFLENSGEKRIQNSVKHLSMMSLGVSPLFKISLQVTFPQIFSSHKVLPQSQFTPISQNSGG